jgi:nucleoside-diphosphate-sugar epimerase
MRVFITGSTGYIGSATVQAFVAAGHQVTGMVHSPEKASAVTALGATPLIGDIKSPSTYQVAAVEHDALIHLAVEYSPQSVTADQAATQTLLAAARSQRGKRCFVYTSGVWVLGDTGGKAVDESAPTNKPAPVVSWRPSHEKFLTEATTGDVAMCVIRPGIVYGGKHGLVSHFFETAVKEGAAAYVGSGENHWPLVHRDDLARLYVIAAEKKAWGIFHGVDGQPTKVVEVARAASNAAGKGGKVRSVPVEEARKGMGGVADALCLDQRIVAKRSVDLGWKPTKESFVNGAGDAFKEWSA